MTKNYYIIRHGETFATKRKSIYGFRIFSAPILDEGIPVIKKMASHLKSIPTDLNVSSPVKRCRQTVGIVSSVTGKEFSYDNRLSEYFIETFGYFRGRIKKFLLFTESSPYQNVLICTHGAVIAGLTHLILENEFKRSQIMNFPPPGVITQIKNNKMTRIDFNK